MIILVASIVLFIILRIRHIRKKTYLSPPEGNLNFDNNSKNIDWLNSPTGQSSYTGNNRREYTQDELRTLLKG